MKHPISLDLARLRAMAFVSEIQWACERVEIAGSIRRSKPEVGDIEIVAIPKFQEIIGLFGDVVGKVSVLDSAIHHPLLMDGEKQKKIDLGAIFIDLFIVRPETWGVQYLLRTGSADFSKWMVTPRRQGGAMPSYMRVQDGRIWDGSKPYLTPEEHNIFNIYGMEFVPPEERSMGRWNHA